MFLDDGCPVRFEVAAIGSFSETHHCWPGLETGRLGDLYFYKDPERLLGRAELTARFDPDVVLPDTATDTGYRQDTRSLWLDPTDQTVVYVADAQHAEGWPVADLQLACD